MKMKTNRHEPGVDGSTRGPSHGQLHQLFAKLQQILFDGLRHGYFEFSVSGEAIQQERRRVVIKAGNSHVFVVPAEELKTRHQ